MNDSIRPRQRVLFDDGRPRWTALPREAQQQVIEVLSQLLLDGLQCCGHGCLTTGTTTENGHESKDQ